MPDIFDKGIFVLVCVLVLAGIGNAVVLHPDGEPEADFSDIDIPDTNVIGRWGSNASCVAIGRNLIITTIHQDSYNADTFRPVNIAGRYYTPSQVWTTSLSDDIRIVKLNHADLEAYSDIYTNQNEPGLNMVQGGYGKSRDVSLDYGYTWKSESNTTLRFCSNKVENTGTQSYKIYADFDELGVGDATEFEGIAAAYDSGSGWFIKSNGEWKLAAITYGVTRKGESWFDDPDTSGTNPDYMTGWRISKFASWIDSVVNEQPDCDYVETDLNDDCVIDIYDLVEFAYQWASQTCGISNNYCEGADINQDTNVDLADFADIAEDWLADYTE